MKRFGFIVLIMLGAVSALSSTNAFAREKFQVQLLDERFVLIGDVETREDEMLVRDARIYFAGQSVGYRLATSGGWGYRPLDGLCSQISGGKFGFASSTGASTPGIIFGENILIVGADKGGRAGSYEAVNTDRGIFYKDLQCTATMLDGYE